MNKISSQPVVMECPSYWARRSLPDADTFECNYCGKEMLYILNPSGNQVHTYDPDGSFNYSCSGSGDRVDQGSFSTGLLTIPEQDKLVISAVDRVDVFDTKRDYYNQTITIDYNVAEGVMFAMTIDLQVDLSFTSVVISY